MAQILPDAEKLTVDYLLDTPAVADAVNDRIYTEIPATPTFPLVRLHLVTDAPTKPHWLTRATIQFDIYGGAKSTTRLIAATCRAVLEDMGGTHDLAVVSHVQIGGLQWLPDDDWQTDNGKARPRYLFDAIVTYHPIAS